MKVGCVAPYVQDAEACRRCWLEPVGRIAQRRPTAGGGGAQGARTAPAGRRRAVTR